jgi:hypothetical protein
MAFENLQNLERIGQLKAEIPANTEFEGLVLSGQKRLKDAENESLSLESRFDLAYNATHALSLAALRWHGFRSNNRYLVFQCLEHTVNLPSEKRRVLDQAHRKRNLSEYEGIIDIDSALVESIIRIAREIEESILALSEPENGWME